VRFTRSHRGTRSTAGIYPVLLDPDGIRETASKHLTLSRSDIFVGFAPFLGYG
jgi:hypothetical protein